MSTQDKFLYERLCDKVSASFRTNLGLDTIKEMARRYRVPVSNDKDAMCDAIALKMMPKPSQIQTARKHAPVKTNYMQSSERQFGMRRGGRRSRRRKTSKRR